ncbi:MAG: 5-bromo-4-chloroindolyl phosphate hydrolysis family protein [Oscillospiraceae bacterium]|nr:5-bromo-4-chloroindolyl phosphate hydrolysis family protein [Oscillospiraceae bacterium]
MKKFIKSNAPPLLLGATWLFYSLFVNMYEWWHYAIAFALSLIVYIIARVNIKSKIIETPIPFDEIETQASAMSGDTELGSILEKGKDYVRQIYGASLKIGNININNKADEIVKVCDKIFHYIEGHTDKLKDINLFMNYYLPTTVELLNSYSELESQDNLGGTQIAGTMLRIEESMNTLAPAYNNLLDDLHSDKAMTVSADITVLQNMLERQGLLEGVDSARN